MSGDQFTLGPFRLDLARRELSRAGIPLQLSGRALDILCVLASANGDVVAKNTLMNRVWPDLAVEDSNVHVHVSALRKALEEAKSGESYIVTVAGRGYRLIGLQPAATSGSADEERAVASPAPARPSIAVLPFSNLSGDPEQEYFADGIVEEIITALSRIRWLFVIARNSTFTYKGRAVDVTQVGRDLGVRYVLEGSVRKAANRVRITGQLVDAASGAHLWADRFDGELEDIFDLQDKVTASVVGAIAPKIEQAEIERAQRKPTKSLDAYDYFLRGMASVYRWTDKDSAEALRLFHKATELDPNFGAAYGAAGWCSVWRNVNGWTPNRDQEIAEAARLARRVAQSGKDDAAALSFGGLAWAYVAGDLEAGAALIDRALVLNPNLAVPWIASGWVRAFLGEPEAAIDHLARAMRLSPLDPLMFLMHTVTALAHFTAGRYAEASFWAAKACREQPNFLAAVRLAAASNAVSGHVDEARKAIAVACRLDPDLRLSNLKNRTGPLKPATFAQYAGALRLAGLPD